MSTSSAVEISSVTPADYEALAEARVRAFEFDEVMTSTYPLSIRPSLEVIAALNVQEQIKQASEPHFDLLKVKASLADGRVVGSATWRIPIDRTSTGGDPLPEEVELKAMLAQKEREGWEDEHDAIRDLGFRGKFGGDLRRIRKERYEGREHWYLNSIFVHPDYQGTGIGSALIAYGTDRADAAGLCTWLEASPHGQQVYFQRGFKVAGWCELVGEEFEGGSLRWPGMERKPVTRG